MHVQAHYGNAVIIESKGKTIRLRHCRKRYNQPVAQNDPRRMEYVEIWEDVIGNVYRLSRLVHEGPTASWFVHRWA